MSEASARFGLPYILPGQAQKELFHNEALARIDAALHMVVEDGPRAAAPAMAMAGQCWIVGAGAQGAWAGHEDHVACWTQGGWRFLAPVPGMEVWRRDLGHPIRWDGLQWVATLAAGAIVIGGRQVLGTRQPAVPSPYGGTIIDAEARAAIDALIATLKSHGITD